MRQNQLLRQLMEFCAVEGDAQESVAAICETRKGPLPDPLLVLYVAGIGASSIAKIADVSVSLVYEWEIGRRNLTEKHRRKLAAASEDLATVIRQAIPHMQRNPEKFNDLEVRFWSGWVEMTRSYLDASGGKNQTVQRVPLKRTRLNGAARRDH